MKEYTDAVKHVLKYGTRKENRTGVDTLSTFGYSYKIDLREGFPLLTTKHISWKNILMETLWLLSGEKHIKFLHKHGCHFWDPWIDGNKEVPSAYGNFWRRYQSVLSRTGQGYTPIVEIDQIAWAIGVLKQEPMSRRICVTAWSPGNAHASPLPPCHAFFVWNVQLEDGEPILCCHMTQRSCDMALGVPYDIAIYGLLMRLFARFTGIEAAYFHHTLVDAHIYTSKPDGSMAEYDHVPGLKEQIARAPVWLPELIIDKSIRTLDDLEQVILNEDTETIMQMFNLVDYNPRPSIKFKVAP